MKATKKDFESQYFETADDLVQAKTRAEENSRTRRARLKLIRRFTNMLPTMTDEEMEQVNRTENTNFGLVYTDLLGVESQLTSTHSTTSSFVEIIVDTGNAEKDQHTGQRLSEAINKGAVHHQSKFSNFVKKIAGEVTMAGGCPVTQNERYGWLPKLRLDMLFPKGTPLEAEQVTYAFDPEELSMSDLKKMLSQIGEKDDGKRLNKANIQALIDQLEKQIKENQKTRGSTHGRSVSKTARDTGGEEQTVTISAWSFYEVKWDDDGQSFVSFTLFTDGICGLPSKKSPSDSPTSNSRIIEYVEKAYPSATDWLQMIFIDSEIGGVKTVDSCIGIAERVYPSAIEIEDLMNLVLEGDKEKSKPKYQDTGDGNPDEIEKWDSLQDSFVPKGLAGFEQPASTNQLQTPMTILKGSVSRMTASPLASSGREGENHFQQEERVQSGSALTSNRLADWSNQMDSLLETMVWRILAGKVKPGSEGYNEIMWCRDYLKKHQIPYKELATRKYGRFEFLRVKSKRVIGNGDMQGSLEAANWLMNNQMNFPPTSRPTIVNRATAIVTGDPDLADFLSAPPQAILNAQKITAENECDTIRRRAVIGQTIPVAPDDVNQDHIPVHLLDLQCILQENQFIPWSKLDVIQFSGLAFHTMDHIKILQSNPMTVSESKPFILDLQNLVAAAQPIIDEVNQREGSEVNQLTEKEKADLQLKMMAEHRKGVELGIKVEELNRLDENRQARAILATRSQYASEVHNDRRLKLDAAKAVEQDKPQ